MKRPTHQVRRLAPGLVAWVVLLIAGCGEPAQPVLAVGAGSDPESVVLAHLYAGALRGSGAKAQARSVADPLADLDSGSVDVVPGFTGRLLAVFAPGATVRSDGQVYRMMAGALPEGIAAGDYADAAEDKPTLAVTKSTADTWGGTDLGALTAHCSELTVGGITGRRTPTSLGRCHLPGVRPFGDDGELFAALRSGQITAAWTTTADPGVPDGSEGIVLLVDGRPALIRAENVVPLYRRNALTEAQLLAINQVAGVLDTAALTDMRRQVEAGADPQTVTGAWLAEHPLGR